MLLPVGFDKEVEVSIAGDADTHMSSAKGQVA